MGREGRRQPLARTLRHPGPSLAARHEVIDNLGSGEVTIHRRDGKIRDSDTYSPSRDPNPPEGQGVAGRVTSPPASAPALSRPPTVYHRPATLRLPARPPKLIYLDLNHWIALAKAQSGHAGGAPFREALEACVAAVERRAAVFPLSDAIYFEVSKIGPYRQRRHLAEAMERVAQYVVVSSRSVIADHEVEALLDRLIGPRPDPISEMAYLDWGIARAFGKVGGFRVRNTETGEDVTDYVRSIHPIGAEAFDAVLADAELRMNREIIEGPSPEEELDLRRRGWSPTAAHEVAQRRAQQEIDQVARFDAEPEWRRGRIRDVIAAREVLIELNEKLTRGLCARRVDHDRLFADEEAAESAFDAMPSHDVAVTMKAAYHRDPAHDGRRTTFTTSTRWARHCRTATSSLSTRQRRCMPRALAWPTDSGPPSCRASLTSHGCSRPPYRPNRT